MRALFYRVNPVGWVTCKWLRRFWPGCLRTSLNGLTFRDVPPPELPGDDWVRVRTLLAGICGTDVALLAQKQPPNSILQAFSSLPAGFGHENVAEVDRVGAGVDKSWLGRRVCVEPTLSCGVRGIDPPCDRCRQGQFGACQSFAAGGPGRGAGSLPPGTSIGYNARTGGAYGEFFVAHASQLVPVPDPIPDELAVLTDPIACSLHAVLRADLVQARQVLVYGAGALGLGVVASLRAVGFQGRVDALDVAGYLRGYALGFGADEFVELPPDDRGRYERIAQRTGATVQRARFGNYMLSGGYDIVFECTGDRRCFNEALRWTRSRGQVVMVGTGHGGRIDLTPVWFTELTVTGAYGRQIEDFRGRKVGTYCLVHELMLEGRLDLRRMLTHTFRLEDYRRAFAVVMSKEKHRAVKAAFDLRGGTEHGEA